MRGKCFLFVCMPLAFVAGCEELDDDPDKYLTGEQNYVVPLDEVAVLLSEIRMGKEHLKEVYDAVTSSSWNGYDEEYMMKDLFVTPGAGVGDDRLPEASVLRKRQMMGRDSDCGSATKAADDYDVPLKDLIAERLKQKALTRSGEPGNPLTPDEYVKAFQTSDIQIYWAYSENWDGEDYPIITFDPDDGSSANVGYRLVVDDDGSEHIEEVIVDEELASEKTVWVINRNDDSRYTSLEMLRMQEPEWGQPGGEIIIKPKGAGTKSNDKPLRTLILRDFTMNRNYDSWFAGASEFFVKIGSLEEFTASTEAELRLYNPSVTDFMIVVKRKNVGVPQPFNAVLVSDWTDQLTHCAFMITEDDGGTRTSWKCSAIVKINSKSYGFEMTMPLNTKDDIVWRGQLARKYIETNNGVPAHYGDVDLTFEILEH